MLLEWMRLAAGVRAQSPLPPLTEPALIAEWLSDITGEPLTDVCQKLVAESRLVGHNVRKAARRSGLTPHVWTEQLSQFYSETNAFLYETAVWNASHFKYCLRETVCQELLVRLPPKATVLCYGDGLGFDSAAVARLGFRVTCYEVSGPCLEFARRVFDLNGLNCQIATDESQFQAATFDAIICLDVLEHVPDPAAVVRQFSSWLKNEGLLIVHAPFYHVDSTRPTHLGCNRHYSGSIRGLYRPAGFRLVDCRGVLFNPLLLQKRVEHRPGTLTWGLRSRVCFSQVLLYAARHLPFLSGMVASVICRPPRKWRHKLEAARDEESHPINFNSFVQRVWSPEEIVDNRKCA